MEIGERKKGVFSIKTLKDADALIGHEGRKAVVVVEGGTGLSL